MFREISIPLRCKLIFTLWEQSESQGFSRQAFKIVGSMQKLAMSGKGIYRVRVLLAVGDLTNATYFEVSAEGSGTARAIFRRDPTHRCSIPQQDNGKDGDPEARDGPANGFVVYTLALKLKSRRGRSICRKGVRRPRKDISARALQSRKTQAHRRFRSGDRGEGPGHLGRV